MTAWLDGTGCTGGPEACTGAVRKPARGLFVSQFGSLHGRGVHVGSESFDGSRMSDEAGRDGLERGNQWAGNLYGARLLVPY